MEGGCRAASPFFFIALFERVCVLQKIHFRLADSFERHHQVSLLFSQLLYNTKQFHFKYQWGVSWDGTHNSFFTIAKI